MRVRVCIALHMPPLLACYPLGYPFPSGLVLLSIKAYVVACGGLEDGGFFQIPPKIPELKID